MSSWVDACHVDDIDAEDLIRWDHNGHSYAIYRTDTGFYCTDGFCTHEQQHLEDGLVDGLVIECPLHQGRFNIATGKALSAPVCVDLATYEVELRDDMVFVKVG